MQKLIQKIYIWTLKVPCSKRVEEELWAELWPMEMKARAKGEFDKGSSKDVGAVGGRSWGRRWQELEVKKMVATRAVGRKLR